MLLLLEHLLWQQRQLRNVRPIRRDPEQKPGDLLRRKSTLESCHHLLELGVLSLRDGGYVRHQTKRGNGEGISATAS